MKKYPNSSTENSLNIYFVLGLDPNKPWDPEEFNRVLKLQDAKWEKTSSLPTQDGRQAKKNRNLIPEIRRIAGDPELREMHREEARFALDEAPPTPKTRQAEQKPIDLPPQDSSQPASPQPGACPNCGKVLLTENSDCDECGFPISQRDLALDFANKAEREVDNGKYNWAAVFTYRAMEAWPSHNPSDPLKVRIEKLADLIHRALGEQTKGLIETVRFMDQNKYYSADLSLSRLKEQYKNVPVTLVDLQTRIRQVIQIVEEKIDSAEIAKDSSNADQAVRLYSEALAICSDCDKARIALQGIPPSPPENLRLSVRMGNRVQLDWEPSPSPGVDYCICKSIGERVLSVDAGNIIGYSKDPTFEDQIEVGLSYYYAIYSRRTDVLSADCADVVEPIFITAEVENLLAFPMDRTVEFTWQPPANVTNILIRRSEVSFPSHPRDGQAVPILDSFHAKDMPLENEVKYFYSVFAVFNKGREDEVVSSGVHITAIPQPLPEPITELGIQRTGRGDEVVLNLSWPAPSRGTGAILRSTQPTGLEYGMVLSRAEIASRGSLFESPDNTLPDHPGSNPVIYYTPVIMIKDIGRIGLEEQYFNIDDVCKVEVSQVTSGIHFRWNWPKGCSETQVMIWPAGDETDGQLIPGTQVFLDEYEKKGYYEIPPLPKGDYYAEVRAIYKINDDRIETTGERRTFRSGKIELSYRMGKTLLTHGTTIQFETIGKGRLPDMLLIYRQKGGPLVDNKDNLVQRFEGFVLKNEHHSWSAKVNTSKLPRGVYLKLVLEDDSLYEGIKVIHPDQDNLRIKS